MPHARPSRPNSPPKSSIRTQKYRLTELAVCRALEAQGWTEVTHDVECASVQIDIIARSPAGVLTLVEVKTQTRFGHAHLDGRQRLRLFRAAAYLAQCEPIEVRLALAGSSGIRLLPVDAI